MQKDILNSSKLLILLDSLDDKEFKDLGLWVRSPFLNSSKNVVNLYEGIKAKRKKDKPVELLNILKKMGALPSSAKQKDITLKHKHDLRKTMYLLSTNIQDFLMWKNIQANPVNCQTRLVDELLKRQLYQFVPAIMNKTRKLHNTSQLRDVENCENAHRLTKVDFYMDIILTNRNATTGIKDVVDTLRQSCLSQLLRYYCVVVNSRKYLKIEDDYPFMKVIQNYLESHQDVDFFTIRVYHLLLKVLEEEQPDDYYEFKQFLLGHLDAFDNNETRQLLGFMSNYCHRMLGRGHKEFVKERFDIYHIGLKRNCWTAGVFFPGPYFVQIIKTALQLDKIKYVNDFIYQYKDTLSPDIKDNLLKYCHALVAFKFCKYDEAQKHLYDIDSAEDFIYHLEYKILMLKIHYENNDLTIDNIDIHPTNNEIEALKQYLLPSKQRKMSEITRQRYSNFVNFFKRILNRKKRIIEGIPPNHTDLSSLQIDLQNISPLIEREWLEKKLSELFE